MKLGVHEQYQGAKARTIADTVARFPLVEVTREFEGGVIEPQSLVTRIQRRCSPIWAAGKTAVWSFKPEPRSVLAGSWDGYLEGLARYLQKSRLFEQTVIVPWHEPENDMSADSFVALFDHVHDTLTAVEPGITTSHAALGYWYRNVSVDQARAWTTKATIHSIDLYSGRSFPLAMTLGTSDAFATWKASRPDGARWGVSERGWIADASGSADRVTAIDMEADWLRGLSPVEQPDFYIVWNTPGTEGDKKIVLDVAGVNAVNDLFNDMGSIDCPLCHGSGRVPPGTVIPQA